jgi:hypothetical protein
MQQDDSLKLIESLDLRPILSGAAATVSNEMATCTLDMAKLSVDIQTLNRQPVLFGYLAFLGGWSAVQTQMHERVPADVAARRSVLACVADYLSRRLVTEDALTP